MAQVLPNQIGMLYPFGKLDDIPFWLLRKFIHLFDLTVKFFDCFYRINLSHHSA